MRKFIISSLIALLMVFTVGNLTWAEDFIRVKGFYWHGILDGEVKSSTKFISGTKVNLRRDLHTEISNDIPGLEVKFNLPEPHKIVGSYWQTTYEGKKTLIKGVSFGGKSYAIGERVNTDLDIKCGSILYERLFIPESLARAFPWIAEAEFGLLAGVEYLAIETKIASATTGVSDKQDAALPIPVLGLFTQFGFLQKRLVLKIGLVGIGGRIGDYDFKFVDAYAELKVEVTGIIPLGIGYKIVDLEVGKEKDDEFSVDLSVDGLYFFTSMSF